MSKQKRKSNPCQLLTSNEVYPQQCMATTLQSLFTLSSLSTQMMTEAFSENISKTFSNFKLVAENLNYFNLCKSHERSLKALGLLLIRKLGMRYSNLPAVLIYSQQHSLIYTYIIIIFHADISSLANKDFHDDFLAFSSCNMQGTPLIEGMKQSHARLVGTILFSMIQKLTGFAVQQTTMVEAHFWWWFSFSSAMNEFKILQACFEIES